MALSFSMGALGSGVVGAVAGGEASVAGNSGAGDGSTAAGGAGSGAGAVAWAKAAHGAPSPMHTAQSITTPRRRGKSGKTRIEKILWAAGGPARRAPQVP